ncbi:MAG: TonB-dependent receptor, partial [Thermoanaerobaculia bacterium]|nr:TonB-dependent receptor [Thermoanaerobaculia bacterium]
MLHQPSRFPRFLFALLIFALIPIAATAQVDKGVIEVTVVDESSAVIPGVTVTLRDPATGATAVNVTGANGLARVAGLAPGTWTMTAELEGFAPVEQKGIVLRVGQTNKVGVTLRPQASEAITVEAFVQVVDVFKSDTSSNIVPEQIESLPVADRDFQRLAFIAPGVQRERGGFRFIGGGPVIGSAGNASQSTIMVDGVDFTDQALGLARTRFSQDAIREFRVVQNRFDTEIGGSAGGALSIVTKSGTNDLKGTVFGFYRDDAFREAGELEVGDLPYTRYQLGFTVGGPIVVDRTHFFASFEQVDEENIALFRPGGAFASQAADIDHPFVQSLAFGSLNHRISDRQSVAARFVYETYEEENFRVGGINDVTYGYTLERDNYNIALEHNWAASGSTFNELRFQVGHRKYFEPTNSDAVSEWFSQGATLLTGANITGDILGEGDLIEIRDTYHFVLGGGAHNVKAGVSAAFLDELSDIPVYPSGLFIWVTDTRVLPLAYAYGTGSAEVNVDTSLYGVFIEDEWRPSANLKVNLGLRWDYDSDGNNPDFTHPLLPDGRDTDTDNFQPRLGINWDVTGEGTIVARGGAGLFTGRYLLVPSFTELQQN